MIASVRGMLPWVSHVVEQWLICLFHCFAFHKFLLFLSFFSLFHLLGFPGYIFVVAPIFKLFSCLQAVFTVNLPIQFFLHSPLFLFIIQLLQLLTALELHCLVGVNQSPLLPPWVLALGAPIRGSRSAHYNFITSIIISIAAKLRLSNSMRILEVVIV